MNATSRLLSGLAAAGLIACVGATPSHAALWVIGSEDGDEAKFFAIDANKNVSSFFGSIGRNNSEKDVGVATIGNVNTDNGYGEIKPIKKGTFTSLTFTPGSTGFAFDGMLFRGQIVDAAGSTFDGNVFATINGATQLEWTGVKSKADFGTLGFDEPAGAPGTKITSVKIWLDATGDFKSFKQIDFSVCGAGDCGGVVRTGAVPEPSTWAMMLLERRTFT
jgi:hypothetical protein